MDRPWLHSVMSAPTKIGARIEWFVVRLCIRTIFAALRLLAPYLDRQRDYEQATGAFTPEINLALDVLDQERHR